MKFGKIFHTQAKKNRKNTKMKKKCTTLFFFTAMDSNQEIIYINYQYFLPLKLIIQLDLRFLTHRLLDPQNRVIYSEFVTVYVQQPLDQIRDFHCEYHHQFYQFYQYYHFIYLKYFLFDYFSFCHF